MSKLLTRIFAVVGMVAGIVMIIAGLVRCSYDPIILYDNSFYAENNVPIPEDASFGGDYYTYSYRGSRNISVALREVNDTLIDMGNAIEASDNKADIVELGVLEAKNTGYLMIFAGIFAFCAFGVVIGKTLDDKPLSEYIGSVTEEYKNTSEEKTDFVTEFTENEEYKPQDIADDNSTEEKTESSDANEIIM